MHEYSLVRALLREVEKLMAKAGDVIVTEVRIQIGPLSGVEPQLLLTAFANLAPDSSLPEAELFIKEVPLMAECSECGSECEIVNFRFQCTHCHATRMRVTSGDTMLLESIGVQSQSSEAQVS